MRIGGIVNVTINNVSILFSNLYLEWHTIKRTFVVSRYRSFWCSFRAKKDELFVVKPTGYSFILIENCSKFRKNTITIDLTPIETLVLYFLEVIHVTK